MREIIKNVASLAAPCVGIGALLVNQGYRRSGWIIVGVGGVIVLLGFLSQLVAPLARLLVILAMPIRLLARAVSWLLRRGQFWLVRKLVVPVLAIAPDASPTSFCWSAKEQRVPFAGGQRADYLKLQAAPDQRVRGLEFSLRPDYQFTYWRAGFGFGWRDEQFEQTDITSGFLFHLWSNDQGEQTMMLTYSNRQASQPTGLPQYANQARTPVYVVRANLWRIPNTTRVRVSISVNNVNLQSEAEIDVSLTRQLLLLGWADGRRFRLHFDDIQVSWGPYDE